MYLYPLLLQPGCPGFVKKLIMRIIARICRRTQAANWFVEGPLTAWIRVTTADYWFEFVKPLLDLIKNILATFSFNYRMFIKYCFFFEDFKIYSELWPLSVSPRCQCVYTMAGQTPALQQNWQSSVK